MDPMQKYLVDRATSVQVFTLDQNRNTMRNGGRQSNFRGGRGRFGNRRQFDNRSHEADRRHQNNNNGEAAAMPNRRNVCGRRGPSKRTLKYQLFCLKKQLKQLRKMQPKGGKSDPDQPMDDDNNESDANANHKPDEEFFDAEETPPPKETSSV